MAVDGGQPVPGKRRKKPVDEPKYCHESAASRSKLLANIGSKCDDHATDDFTLPSKPNRMINEKFRFLLLSSKIYNQHNDANYILYVTKLKNTEHLNEFHTG